MDKNFEEKDFNILLSTYNLKRMSKNECLIYSLVNMFNTSGKLFYFSNATICKALKICEKTLQNNLKRLKDKQLIEVYYRKNTRYIRAVPYDTGTLELFKKVFTTNQK